MTTSLAKSRANWLGFAIEGGFLGPSLRLIAIGLKNLRGNSISRIQMAAGDTTVGSRPSSGGTKLTRYYEVLPIVWTGLMDFLDISFLQKEAGKTGGLSALPFVGVL